MNRKDKTVKQLQAECRKRKVGFMMNWTKVALTKRLEDEDKRELASKKVEDKATKEMNKAKKELETAKIEHSSYVSKRDAQYDQSIKELQKSDPKTIEQNAIDTLIKQKQRYMNKIQTEFDALQIKQNEVLKENSIISQRKSEILMEIESLKILIKSLI